MNKFTKGEWTNFDFRHSPDLYQNGHFQIVGNNQTENVAIIPAHWGSAQANAHLIAASPDLYEACDTALMFLMDFDDKQVAPIVDKLKRALKKAEVK